MKRAHPYASTIDHPLLLWLKDETFFSLCSRFHLFSGEIQAGATASRLFGIPAQRIRHDLPCGMGEFEHRSSSFWGSAEEIILRRTIFPFFVPFQSGTAVSEALQTLKGARVGALKYRMGVVSGGYGADHPLKACQECMTGDIAESGVAYWHLSHQYPGVVICPTHGVVLHVCTHNRRWSNRFGWTLPTEGILRKPTHALITTLERGRLLSLGSAALEVAALGTSGSFDVHRISRLYRREIQQRGAEVSLLEHLDPLRRFSPFEGLPVNEAEARCCIEGMIRPPRGHHHPLKHILMITWLFGDIGAFKDNYRFLDSHILEQRCNDPIRIIPSIELTGSGSRSGPLRPKKLKPSVRKRLLELLREGQPKEIICAEFQVTVSTVNKLLRTEHEVLASRRKRERDQAVALNRSLWCSLRYRFPDENATSLRAREPKTYAWLYRNDRDWLRLEAIHIPSSNRNFVPLKDWEARDDRLCCLIEEAVRAELACDPATISIPKLFELVPKLASSLEKRNRYPRTRRLLNSLRGMVR